MSTINNTQNMGRLKLEVDVNKSGKATFATLDDLAAARRAMVAEARASGVEPTREQVGGYVCLLLDLYEKAQKAWKAAPDGTSGHVYEVALRESKAVLLLGSFAALSKVNG